MWSVRREARDLGGLGTPGTDSTLARLARLLSRLLRMSSLSSDSFRTRLYTMPTHIPGHSAVNKPSQSFTVELSPTRAFSLLKAPTSAFRIKNLLLGHYCIMLNRHFNNDVKLGGLSDLFTSLP